MLGVWWILHLFNELPLLLTVMPGAWPEAVTENPTGRRPGRTRTCVLLALTMVLMGPPCILKPSRTSPFPNNMDVCVKPSWHLLMKLEDWVAVLSSSRPALVVGDAAVSLGRLSVGCHFCFMSLSAAVPKFQPLLKRGERESWLKITSRNKYLLFTADFKWTKNHIG